MAISTRRAKIILKIIIILAILAIPFVVLLKRADMIEFGGPMIIKFKPYETLNQQEKIRRAGVWYKFGSYRNAVEIYTELLFGVKFRELRHSEYGNLPLVDPDMRRVDLMFYRWCMCLSKLNKRRQGMAACSQFLELEQFEKSKCRAQVEKLRKELVGRQL